MKMGNLQMLKNCPACNCDDIYSHLNPNYLKCSGCEWKVTYRFLRFDPTQKIEFVFDRSMPCVDCGLWVPIEDIIDGLCLRCFSDLMEAEENDEDF